MEKEILEKIYLLRKIKPEKEWSLDLKEKILESSTQEKRDYKTVVSALGREVLTRVSVLQKGVGQLASGSRNGPVVAGAFAFLFIFSVLTLPHFPLDYSQDVVYFPAPVVIEEEGEEEVKMVAKEDEMNVEKKDVDDPIEKEIAVLKEGVRGLKMEVLGMMIERETEMKKEELTEKEIAEYLLEVAKEKQEEDVEMMILSEDPQESEEAGALKKEVVERMEEKMDEAKETEDYGKVIDYALEEMPLDILLKEK